MQFIKITSVLFLMTVEVKTQMVQSSNCSDTNIQRLCLDQEACDECLQADPCCNWCYDGDYTGRKCNTESNLKDCNLKKIEINSESSAEIPEGGNKRFTDGDAKEVIQIQPQWINLKLGKDTPVNFTFTYKSARNYPLDLYYLGDLSVSMREHLSMFKTLGADLPNNLTKLTKNYRLAYGSFLDKIGMPFYFTAPSSFDNPCLDLLLDDCEKGYLFKHRLSFTKDAAKFAEKVGSSKITANVDDLDGALDAILQILVCDDKMGWSVNSRKIILLPTDSLLHSAGDGLLVGAVLQPNSSCLMDDDGNHISPLVYDYPSVGQIDELLKKKKINIIFAVKDKLKLEYYKNLTKELLMDSAFVGELEEDSKNILQLISKGFYNFARQVSFSINASSSENLDVQFFADCEGVGVLNRTSSCYNVEDNSVQFTVQLTLKGRPTKQNDLLYIEEKNINERVTLNISYLGLCQCKHYEGEHLKCLNGNFRCGQCMCDEDWTGTLCDESCDEDDNFNSCRLNVDGTISSICHRRGDCICGKCRCDYSYSGKYCEYVCPVNSNGAICSGLAQGKCIEGKCECKNDFIGEDCSCSKSTKNCKMFEAMSLCSGRGECECNRCKCGTGFSGQYCELNKDNNTLCEDYRGYVEAAVANGTTSGVKDDTKVVVDEMDEEKRNDICGISCETATYVGNRLCTIKFCYHSSEDGVIHLLTTRFCYMTAGFTVLTTAVIAFLAIIMAGLVMIGCTKYRIYRLEQAEYRQFENDKKNFSEMNPIYKDPVTTYRNPMRRKND